MKLKTLSPWTIDILAAFLPVGALLTVLAAAEAARTFLPEPFGNSVGTILAVGGAWFLAWCISPVQPKEAA